MGFYSDQEQKKIISANLTELIEQSGKEQKQISIDLDINPPTFNQWVTGKAIPAVSILKRIADYFNVSIVRIVDPPDAPSRKSTIVTLSTDEMDLVNAFNKADPSIQSCILKLLDL